MRKLKGGIARCMPNHRSAAGKAYAAFCEPYIARCSGTLPREASRLLVELWRMDGELDTHAADYERAMAQRRRKDANRAKRLQGITRKNYVAFLKRLNAIVEQQPVDIQTLLHGVGR